MVRDEGAVGILQLPVSVGEDPRFDTAAGEQIQHRACYGLWQAVCLDQAQIRIKHCAAVEGREWDFQIQC